MLSAIRPNTYRTQMPSVTTEFFHFNGAEDEAAADLLATHILGLILKARKNALAKMLKAQNPAMNNNNEETGKKKNKVKSGLVNMLSKPGQVDVRLPADMMQRLVRDIVRMSEGEEHGIRGCTIIIQLIDGGASANIGRIVCDPKIKSSSLLQLRLARGPPPPHAVSHFSLFKFLNTNVTETVYISPGYTLEKRRLPTST